MLGITVAPVARLGGRGMVLVSVALLIEPCGQRLVAAAGAGPRADRLVVDVWQVDEGLPQNSVHAILQTRDGYLWLGTQEGLVRFDGVSFTVFDVGNTEGLESSYVRALFEDPAGNVWVGTEGGLTLFRAGRAETYTTKQGLPHAVVSALAGDAEGNLWVGTYGGGLARLRDGRFSTYTTEHGLPSNLVRAILVDRGGGVWIGTDGGGLCRMEGGSFRAYKSKDGLPHDSVHALHESRDGSLWIGTGGGLARLRNGRFTTYTTADGLAEDAVYALHEDREGSVWIGTAGGGLSRWREGVLTTPVAPGSDGLSNGIVYAIREDREGSLWVGTGGGGLNRLRRGPFATLTRREGLSDDMVSTIYEDREGTLWIGTWGGGLDRYRDGRVRTYSTADGLSSNIVSSLFEDRLGNLWIGTYDGGLNRFAGGSFTVYTTRQGLPNDTVWGMAEDRGGAIWIGTSDGLARLEDGRITSLGTRDGLPSPVVRVLHVDRKGVLWIGTHGGGLARLENGAVAVYDASRGLSNDKVYSLYEDEAGALWIGTGGGLNRLADGALRSFTKKDGLCEDRVFRILDDRRGNLWMSSNKGIFRVGRRELEALALGRQVSLGCSLYGRAAGMRSAECSGGSQPAGWRTRDGRLWFPTIQGAVVVDPGHTVTNTLPPPVVIEEATVDGRGGVATGAVLPPGRGELEFRYTALSFLEPRRVRFRYRLRGFDDGWVQAGERRIARYTNIPPGEYVFDVRACNNDGIWNEAGSSLAFRLRPHLYQTKAFALLCGLTLAVSGSGLYLARVKRLKVRERDLARLVDERTAELLAATRALEEASRRRSDFVSGVSHELRTPLTLVRLYGETLESEGSLPEDERQGYARIIIRESDRLTRLVEKVLDFSRIDRGDKGYELRPGDLAGVVSEVVATYGKHLERQGFRLTVDVAAGLPPVSFDAQAVSDALLNLLDNASKYSGDGRSIAVRLHALGGRVALEVEDRGIGIAEDERRRIFEPFYRGSRARGKGGYGLGLFLVRHVMDGHGGEVELESSSDRGSRFRLLFPAAPSPGTEPSERPETREAS